jgi:peptidyl-prolyl cis-trans isomerase A (cyclophilin A)
MLTRAALILLCLSLASAAQTAAPKKAAGKTAAAKTPPVAIIHTTEGDMKCTLFPDQAPLTVANFIGLAKGTKTWKNPTTGANVHGKPLYDSVIFHRTIPGFVIQGGDPAGTGSGDVGFHFKDELRADLLYDQPGRLAMANSGPDTNGSQFFITEQPIPFLNPCLDANGCGGRQANTGWTIFGQCDAEAVELVKKIARMPCTAGPCAQGNERPLNPVKIKHIEIMGAGSAAAAKPAAAKKAATATPK